MKGYVWQVQQATYQDAIDFYLRDDVSAVLWSLANTRRLRFFYDADEDIRSPHARTQSISLHCLPNVASFKEGIAQAAAKHPRAEGFFPFIGMAPEVNAPGRKEELIGWDMRFEVDFDLMTSFRAVLPIAAICCHFAIPILLKYSGHRSLHLSIPAEVFPLKMRCHPNKEEWMRAFEELGSLFCRYCPDLSAFEATKHCKDMALSAPFSLHRYNGLVSIPLSLDDILGVADECGFDVSSAALCSIGDIRWGLPASYTAADGDAYGGDYGGSGDGDGDGMSELLAFAQAVKSHPQLHLKLAGEVFGHLFWPSWLSVGGSSEDLVFTSLMQGFPGGIDEAAAATELTSDVKARFEMARVAVDSPEAKDMKLMRLFSQESIGFGTPLASQLALREEVCHVLTRWVRDGMASALDHLCRRLVERAWGTPSACAVRLLTIVPEELDVLSRELCGAALGLYHSGNSAITPEALFLWLAIGELAAVHEDTRLFLVQLAAPDDAERLLITLDSRKAWKIERNPSLAIVLLCAVYGAEKVRSWVEEPKSGDSVVVVTNVFASVEKFRHAAAILKRVTVDAFGTIHQ